MAAFYGLKCFASEHRLCKILLRIDNTTAILYINRMGSVQFPKLSSLCREICERCEMRDIWGNASYIFSKENEEADEQSRILPQETEWWLADWAFAELISEFGNFGIDLFASNINSKCQNFVSWHRDPEAIAIDAFTTSWSDRYFYAFPPFSIILRILPKIQLDKAEGPRSTPCSWQWDLHKWSTLNRKQIY